MSEDLLGLVAIVLIFGTPLLITFAIVTTILLNNLMKQRDKENARRAYRELLQEKTDVLKTALVMGLNPPEIEQLDLRLEKLVGEEKLRTVLLGDAGRLKDAAAGEAESLDLEIEFEKVKRIREAQTS